MLKSLVAWCNVPLVINPYVSSDGAGDKTYGTPVNVLCYPVYGAIKVIDKSIYTLSRSISKDEVEIVSNTHLYLDGSIAITVMDTVILNGTIYVIKHIAGFSQNGALSMQVVYL